MILMVFWWLLKSFYKPAAVIENLNVKYKKLNIKQPAALVHIRLEMSEILI